MTPNRNVSRKVKHAVVLVLDGFRYRYFSNVPKEYIPNLWRLAEDGVFYTNFWTVFPSSTYPAHSALLSGCKTGIMKLFKPQGSPYDSPVDSIMNVAQRQELLSVNLIGYEIKVYYPDGTSPETLKRWKRPEGIYAKGFEGHQTRLSGQQVHAEEIIWTIEHINPDIIYCRLPATDWGGHANGALDAPDQECKEAMLELIKETDKLVGEIVKTLDGVWKRENYVMFITADHGMSYAPNNINFKEIDGFLSEHGISAKVEGDVVALIYIHDKKELGKAVELLCSESARSYFHIEKLFWKKEHMEELYGCIRESDMQECPSIVMEPSPGYRYVENPSSMLGSHNTFKETDMHIPLICFGAGVKRGFSINIRGEIIDITPTISYLFGINPPEYSQGEILREIFEFEIT